MGYHEGARRIIKCDGGHITGLDAYMSHMGGFAEPTLNALRVICSSSRLLVEYETGSVPDTMVFGILPGDVAARVKPFEGKRGWQHLLGIFVAQGYQCAAVSVLSSCRHAAWR
jgi:hypothetical protein